MSNQTQTDCRCEKTACGCAAATTSRCSCGETCNCKRGCGCSGGCACQTKK